MSLDESQVASRSGLPAHEIRMFRDLGILKGAGDAPNLASTLISTAFNIGIAAGPWLGGLALNAGWGYARLPWISVFFVAAALAVAILSAALERRAVPALQDA